jgi:quinol monooxygenase YgiN
LYDTDGVKGSSEAHPTPDFLGKSTFVSEKPLDIDVAVLQGTFDAAEGREGPLAGVLARYVVMTRHEPGCRNVDLLTSVTRPGRFCIVEKWDSAALVQQHLDSLLMIDMAREAVPLLAAQPALDLYETISAHDLA